MAEFCIECFNRLNDFELTERDVRLAVDLCEGCAEVKPCIMAIKNWKRRGETKSKRSVLQWLIKRD